ncbi:MAG: TIGR02253 family HAD-type hydrolase [Planctomycetes bacterium]|nr:TIGR02253 family HAD-type hydrolase [Planctomycetota bacterium]MCW8135123.1 TIGR02253 family HAD-type hydrolase [Planctomycetota bacterium]
MADTLRAIFFDIDDTLYSTSEFAALARRNAIENMRAHGFRMATEDALRELAEIVAEFSSNYEHHFDKLLRRVPKHYWEGINETILVAAAVVGYHETKFRELRPYEDAVDVLRLLRDQTDLKLGVITSGLALKQAEKLVRLGVVGLFDENGIFISDELGISKPNPKLWLKACNAFGARPSECMYIGDRPRMDVDPCNRIGMITVLNKRSARSYEPGETQPDYEIHNFFDLLDFLRNRFAIDIKH